MTNGNGRNTRLRDEEGRLNLPKVERGPGVTRFVSRSIRVDVYKIPNPFDPRL